MSKEVTKENLRKFAEDELDGVSNMVESGMMDEKTAKGHVRQLFYLSGTFGLGLQEKARQIIRRLKGE